MLLLIKKYLTKYALYDFLLKHNNLNENYNFIIYLFCCYKIVIRSIYDKHLSNEVRLFGKLWDNKTFNSIRINKIISINDFNDLYKNRSIISDSLRLLKLFRYVIIIKFIVRLYKNKLSIETITETIRTLLSIISFSSWWIITKIYLKLLSKKKLTSLEFSIIGTLWNGTLCYFIDKKYNRKSLTTFSFITFLS